MEAEKLEYAGFWPRVGAAILDGLIILVLTGPAMIAVYGWAYYTDPNFPIIAGPTDFIVTWVLPAVATVLLWIVWQATPGKMAITARIVDARSGAPASVSQYILRYLAYLVSVLPLCLGLIWVAFDSRKRGWHDFIAGTVVVRNKHGSPEPVRFDRA